MSLPVQGDSLLRLGAYILTFQRHEVLGHILSGDCLFFLLFPFLLFPCLFSFSIIYFLHCIVPSLIMSLSSSYIVSFWGKEIHPFLFGSPPQSPCASLWVGDWSGSLHQAWGADRWAVSPLPYLPAGLCLGWLGVALTHILICIYIYEVNPDIFWYFLSFYLCITFMSLFAHHFHFFWNFPYFCCHFIHLKSLSLWHSTLNFASI